MRPPITSRHHISCPGGAAVFRQNPLNLSESVTELAAVESMLLVVVKKKKS